MTYPYGGTDQYPTQSSGGYDTYWPQRVDTVQPSAKAKRLIWVVVVLGAATYLVGCTAVPAPGGIGWGMRFSAFAAVMAALGLPPLQSAHTKVVAVLAVMGFLEALAHVITRDNNPGWSTVVVVVLNALQALAAITALLTRPAAPRATDRGLTLYDTYAYYAQAAQQYYAANDQQPQQQPVQAHGRAHATAPAAAQAEQSAEERYALYSEYLSPSQAGPNPVAAQQTSDADTRIARPASDTGIPTSGPADGIRPGEEPSAGSVGQPWPS